MNTLKPKRRRRTHCFSLIEIMIVVVIIGMLAALVAPNVMKRLGKAQHEVAKAQIQALANACEDYYLDMSEYPSRLEDLIQNPGGEKWDGPYLKPAKIPVDPWQEPYVYQAPGSHSDYDISSLGADKAPGGDGKNSDINNWE